MIKLTHPTKIIDGKISITASKSESNRALIIQALCEKSFIITNLANAQDTQTLQEILVDSKNKTTDKNEHIYNVGAAGTTMRFLTAFFSVKKGTYILTGSERMKKRPIGILVQALRKLGAKIEYMGEDGFPPLKIYGGELHGGNIEIEGNVSSQFITALLLIAPKLKNGLSLKLKGYVTSSPYIQMTLKMMEAFQVKSVWNNNQIDTWKQDYNIEDNAQFTYNIEGDWSAASYWYSIVALSQKADLVIYGLKQSSFQGDKAIADIFVGLGVETIFLENKIQLRKTQVDIKMFEYDFVNCPDLAQTVAVVVSGLNIPAIFNGLHTLKIKETDRSLALKTELNKLGVNVEILNDNSIKIAPSPDLKTPNYIVTYEDHRMAMAFAPLALKLNFLVIAKPEVVKKSYPNFWHDLKQNGFKIENI